MSLRVGQVGARESHVDARARDVEAQITDEKRFWGGMPHARWFRRSRFRCGVLVLAFIGAWLAPVAAPPAALGAQVVHVFPYTGAMQNWTVPAGVHFAHFDVKGAQGGASEVLMIPLIPGGEGGRTVAEVRVFPGEVIHIFVGGKGYDGGPGPGSQHAKGGFNGGGTGGAGNFVDPWGGGGGGASDIRVEGTLLANRIIVAGGGGGASEKLYVPCGFSEGGGGGGLQAADGVAAVTGCVGGTGGTQKSGGVQAGYPDGHGRLGFGGRGRGCTTVRETCGGGGGGGYYGGGGGAHDAGGGGGSGFGPRVDFPPVKFYTGVHKGNGQVIVTFDKPA
jgi:Glycine rich protein